MSRALRMSEEQFATRQSARAGVDARAIERREVVAPQQALLELRSLSFVLPYPPSVNDLYGTNLKTGRKFLVEEQRRFRSEVIFRVRRQMKAAEPLCGRLQMTITLYPPDGRRRDGSNSLKSLEDALQHARAYVNDEQIDLTVLERIRHDQRDECHVTLQEIAA